MIVKQNIISLFLICFASVTNYAQKFYVASPISVNTSAFNEYAPAILNNDIVFISDRKNDWLKTTTDLEGNSLSDIYFAKKNKPRKYGSVQPFSSDINSRFYEGPVCFTKDGKTIYYTRSIDITDKYNKLGGDTTYGIFTAELVNEKWSNVTPFPYNSSDYNVGFPFISDDGRQLFFSSQAPGGQGGFDIYVCNFENGTWSKPENLGENINTPENEIFPFLHNSGRLYFSSRGHGSKGGLDIFYSEIVDGEWKRPVNLPDPFNTRYDDFGLIFNASLDTAFICSKKQGTMDIYMVYSTLPVFTDCPQQQENDYCYLFYDEGMSEVDSSSFKYEWNLGDGTIVRAKEAEHCFAKPGTYNVVLNVIDTLTGEINNNEVNYEFTVEPIKQPYILAIDTARVNEEISFSALETYLPDIKIDKYYWDFGDGQRIINSEVKHVYTKPGLYQIQLGVTSTTDNEDIPPEKICIKRSIVIIR